MKRATGAWQECPAGIAAREKSVVAKTWVQEVASDKPGRRIFVVHSEERWHYERGEREKAMERARVKLEALQQLALQSINEPARANGPTTRDEPYGTLVEQSPRNSAEYQLAVPKIPHAIRLCLRG